MHLVALLRFCFRKKALKLLNFWIFLFYFFSTPVSMKLATKASFGGKKTLIINKNRGVRPKKLSLCDKFEMIMAGLDTYFLEVGACTESSHQMFFKGKENC